MSDPALWVLIVASVLSCFFAANNLALHHLSRMRLEEVLRHKGKEEKIETLVRKRNAFIVLTAVIRTVLNLLILLAAVILFKEATDWRRLLTATLVAGGIIAVLGVAVPGSLARYAGEPLLAMSLPILRLCHLILQPVLWLLHLCDPIIRRLVGAGTELENGEFSPVEQEIIDVASEGEKAGLMDETQKDMIEAVVEFPNKTVGEIMPPRTDVSGIELSVRLDEVKQIVAETGHSRFPIYDGDLDHIVGVLYVKDLLRLVGAERTEPFEIGQILRDALLVPESKTLRALLEEFQLRKVHLAIVLDEYGGTAGLVTIEDILEEIVGEIRDEYEPPDEAEPEINRVNDRCAEADGRVYIDDLNDELEIAIPEDDDYDTVGGFVFSTLGHIPEVGESFDYENVRVTVLAAEKTKINKIRVEILDAEGVTVDETNGKNGRNGK